MLFKKKKSDFDDNCREEKLNELKVNNYLYIDEAIDICKNIIKHKMENDLSMRENKAIEVVLEELIKEQEINKLQDSQIKLLKELANPHFM